MNGYFQLVSNEWGTGLNIFPPTDGGEPISINELIGYLQGKNITYDISSINMAIRDAKAPIAIAISNQKIFPQQEMMEVKVTPNMMEAVARFYPPSPGAAFMGKADILNLLSQQKIVFGIDESAIDAFLAHREYCTDIVIARGQQPRHGTDASIEYFFNTDLRVRPTLNEDGSVDFFNLNTINHCKKGDILARLIKEDPGEKGMSVLGNAIQPRDVKRATLQYSNHILLSPERDVLTSEVNGHVCLVGDRVFVSDVFQVKNVDNSVGNIEYDGSVLIDGNVCSNFSVVVHGDVEVRGVVEGATIQADGNIIIARGMNGMNRGILKAGGNVISKFIENATVEAGGYVEAEAILHSFVSAKTEINVLSRKGFISGGKVTATNKINVKNLGSTMGADTIVEIGIDPETKQKFVDLQKETAQIHKELQQIAPILISANQKKAKGEPIAPDRMKYIQTLAIADKQKKERLQKCTKELEEISILISENKNASVCVQGQVYSGTKIIIADSALTVKESVKYCRFIRQDGEIRMTAL